MVGMELLVAIKLRLPIVYAVFNDARYNMVYHGYRLTFGREALGGGGRGHNVGAHQPSPEGQNISILTTAGALCTSAGNLISWTERGHHRRYAS